MSKACFTANITLTQSISVLVYADESEIKNADEKRMKEIIKHYLDESPYEIELAVEVDQDRFRCLESCESVSISPISKYSSEPENSEILGKVPVVVRCCECDAVVHHGMPKCNDCN